MTATPCLTMPNDRTEAQMRSVRAMKTSDTRIPPTPEDLAISMRQTRRLMRWAEAVNENGGMRVNGPLLVEVVRRAIKDTLHFGPGETT